MTQRYDMRRESNTSWTVFDIETDEPAVLRDRRMIDLEMDDADEMVVLLNRLDMQKRVEQRV